MLGNTNQVVMILQIVIQYAKEVSTVLKKKAFKARKLNQKRINFPVFKIAMQEYFEETIIVII